MTESFIQYATTTHVDLAKSDINFISIRRVCDVIQWNRQLCCLDLAYNNIGDVGSLILCRALQFSTNLKWIDLTANNISDPGVISIAKLICENPSIKIVNLNFNNITDFSIKILGKAIQEGHLDRLLLNHNCISKKGAQTLEKIAANNPSFVLELADNKRDKGNRL